MNRAEARKIVVEALHEAADSLNNPAVSSALNDPLADVALTQVGLDSLDEVSLCVNLEAASGVDIEPAELARFKTVLELADYLVQRTGG